VSKNPPLTEDQIRQSAEAEARLAAAQASRNAQLDYMIAEQRQQQVAAALEAVVGSEEDRFKAAASKIDDSVHRAIEEQDRQAREVGEEISQLVISSNPVGDQVRLGRSRWTRRSSGLWTSASSTAGSLAGLSRSRPCTTGSSRSPEIPAPRLRIFAAVSRR
jgi:hypothetical protein